MNISRTIYLADDDPDDRFLIIEAIKEIHNQVTFIELANGLELLDSINQLTDPVQALILLDMNMPMMNGLEAITAIRSNPRFAGLKAVMVSTSSDPSLAERAFEAGCDGFFIKPDTFDGFVDLAKQLHS